MIASEIDFHAGPRQVQLLRASREAHVEPRERPTRRRVLGQLDGQLRAGFAHDRGDDAFAAAAHLDGRP